MPRGALRAMQVTTVLVVVIALLGLLAVRVEQQRDARRSALVSGEAFTSSEETEPPRDAGPEGFDGRFYADPETGCWTTHPPDRSDPAEPPELSPPPDGPPNGEDGDRPPGPLEDLDMWRAPWPLCRDLDSSVAVDPRG